MTFFLRVNLFLFVFAFVAGCKERDEHAHHEHHKIIATTPIVDDVTTMQQYVCQIHSCRHIDVRALEAGYLQPIVINEGQIVKEGDELFKVVSTLYQAKLDTDLAEQQQAQIELTNSQVLFKKNIVSQQEVNLAQAKLAKATAKVDLTRAELNFTIIKAAFSGIIDRFLVQQGGYVGEGDVLTTLSDNSLMWVYFNVPEARYLEYMDKLKEKKEDFKIELKLANGSIFQQTGKIGAIEADFNNKTGNIAFRADFPNPERLLRHGQTGTIYIRTLQKNAIVIPQRCVFEILAKRYVYIVDEENKVRQREIVIQNEFEDIFVLQEGVKVGDKIVLEGTRQVRDGEEVEFEFRDPAEVLGHLKYRAE